MRKHLLTCLNVLLIGALLISLGSTPAGQAAPGQPDTGITERVSVASDGTEGNSDSWVSSISADGRYVAFDSGASNLVSGDTNGNPDSFVHDRQTGETRRVSVASDGTEGNGFSYWPSISADGRYVAFASYASNLVGGDTNGDYDVFVHDWQTGQTMRVSVASDGTEGNDGSWYSSISADGRYVAFDSYASNLVGGDTNWTWDVFVHDRQTGQTMRVSVASDGTGGGARSLDPAISADGRYVVFASYASNLVSGDTNGNPDSFVHDRQTGETRRVSVASDGTEGNGDSFDPAISADGRYVVFASYASNLVSGDTNGYGDVFVHDQQTGETRRVAVASDGTEGNGGSSYSSISADGRYVAFHSLASNLVSGDTNGYGDVFVHDRQTGQTMRVSVASDGTEGSYDSGTPSISADGRYVAFSSAASNIVSGDTNGAYDAFVHDQQGDSLGCSQASAPQPLMLVTGWGGSWEQDTTLSSNSQLYFFIDWLAAHGYVEGCNLFYATGTSPYLWLDENAVVIRDNLCTAYQAVKAYRPDWNGHFDILAHSYGGLRSRSYLENPGLYGTACPGTQDRVYVDNLFTLGSPHGGEWGDLPLSFVIGLRAIGGGNWPALVEMLPPVRAWQNLFHSQPPQVSYRLLSGDARLQVLSYPPLLHVLIAPFFIHYWLTPNDMAVHRDSAYALWLYPFHYPDLTLAATSDVHGQLPEDIFGPHSLRSYVNPSTTFEEEICPWIVGSQNCQNAGASQSLDLPGAAQPLTMMDVIAQQRQPQQSGSGALMDIRAGTLQSGQVVTGQFAMQNPGPSQVLLSWTAGDVTWALRDPLGNPVDSGSAASDPNIDYLSFDTGYGMLASYQITDTLTGTWAYTITAADLANPSGYRLAAALSFPVAVSASMPEWLPNQEAVVITASVTYSGSLPVAGGSASAQILPPDGITQTLALFDDGSHQDGATNDGVFGVIYDQTAQGGVYGVLLTASGNYQTQSYTRTQTAFFTVAPASAGLNGSYADAGLDENGDSLYEWLGVDVGLTVSTPGTYTLSADIYAGETFITHAYVKVSLEAGAQVVTLRFDGNEIRSQQLDGPYTVRNVLLLDESQGTLLIEAADYVYTTTNYQYRQFGYPNVYLPLIAK